MQRFKSELYKINFKKNQRMKNYAKHIWGLAFRFILSHRGFQRVDTINVITTAKHLDHLPETGMLHLNLVE